MPKRPPVARPSGGRVRKGDDITRKPTRYRMPQEVRTAVPVTTSKRPAIGTASTLVAPSQSRTDYRVRPNSAYVEPGASRNPSFEPRAIKKRRSDKNTIDVLPAFLRVFVARGGSVVDLGPKHYGVEIPNARGVAERLLRGDWVFSKDMVLLGSISEISEERGGINLTVVKARGKGSDAAVEKLPRPDPNKVREEAIAFAKEVYRRFDPSPPPGHDPWSWLEPYAVSKIPLKSYVTPALEDGTAAATRSSEARFG